MSTNSEYLKANNAIGLIKEGVSVENAAADTNASIQLINVMLGNENTITPDEFVDNEVRITRENICKPCEKNTNNICLECACPISFIVNFKFKECPLGKW